MRVGDMNLVGSRPRPALDPWASKSHEIRRVLLMVREFDPGGRVQVRLAQDYRRSGPEIRVPARLAPKSIRRRSILTSIGGFQS
jgi:hypothetical protein